MICMYHMYQFILHDSILRGCMFPNGRSNSARLRPVLQTAPSSPRPCTNPSSATRVSSPSQRRLRGHLLHSRERGWWSPPFAPTSILLAGHGGATDCASHRPLGRGKPKL